MKIKSLVTYIGSFILALGLLPGCGEEAVPPPPPDNPVPSASSLSPSQIVFGGADFTLTVNGSGFVAGSIVRWNGADRPTTFVSSSTEIQATISAADIATTGLPQDRSPYLIPRPEAAPPRP